MWYHPDGSEQRRRSVADYLEELSDVLSVPVRAEPVLADGGRASPPDLLVRSGAGHRLRDAMFDDRPAFPSPGCTTVTVYPLSSRRPPLARRLAERFVF